MRDNKTAPAGATPRGAGAIAAHWREQQHRTPEPAAQASAAAFEQARAPHALGSLELAKLRSGGAPVRSRCWSAWETAEELDVVDLAQRAVPLAARDLVRRDGVVAAAQRRGIISRDLWVIAIRGFPGAEIEVPEPERFLREGPIIDVLAVDPARPSDWRLERGAALVLGVIEGQFLRPSPVRIWQDPLQWLQAGGCGLVLLTGDPHERRQLLLACRSGCVVRGADAGRAMADSIAAARPADPRVLVEIDP